jgi:MFS family permease
MSEENLKPIPAAPIGVTDPEQFAAAEERWANCPLNNCKRNTSLLYEDFYLRDIRTNRLMCSGCAVRAEMGYMAREVIKKSDDRFFQGNQLHNFIVLGIMTGAAAISGLISFLIGWFYFAFIVGGAIGGAGAALARRFTDRKVTREMHYFGGAGIVLGSLLAIFLYSLYLGVPMEYIFSSSLISVGASAAGMFAAAWGVLRRRI